MRTIVSMFLILSLSGNTLAASFSNSFGNFTNHNEQKNIKRVKTEYLQGNRTSLSQSDFLIIGRGDLNLTNSTYSASISGTSVQLDRISSTELAIMTPNLGTTGSKSLTVVINSITYHYDFDYVTRTIVSNPSSEISDLENELLTTYSILEDEEIDEDKLEYLMDIYTEYQTEKATMTSTELAEMITI